MKKELFISDEISSIVDALVGVHSITSIDESSGVSTINTDTVEIFNNLSRVIVLTAGMIVTINDKNYPVSNVINLPGTISFDITATALEATEWAVAANFQTGSRYEVNQILRKQKGSFDRFPLIWLIPNEDEDFNVPLLDFTAPIDIVFIHKANNTDRTEKRITNNFKPVIQPLMTLFNAWLQSSDFNYMLEFYGYEKPIDYTKTNFPFYGTANKEEAVITAVATDAIEVNYELNFKKQYV